MSLIVKDNGSGGDFTPAPEGQFQGVCVDVEDLGISTKDYGQGPKEVDELRVVLQLKVTDAQGQEIKTEQGGRYIVSRTFTKSLSQKSNLRPFLESWRGRKFTQDELDGFNVEKLVGANALVQVVHNISKKNGNKYANIQTVMPINPAFGLQPLTPENYTRKIDRPAVAPAPAPQAAAPVSFVPPMAAVAAAMPLAQDDIPF
jgi:hypothetical protein